MPVDDNNVGVTDGPITFGTLLRRYRETYPDRFREKYPAAPRFKFTALALIECMREHGHPLTSGAYSEIENDVSLPRDPQRFIDVVTKCLLLDDEEDYARLAYQLAYDLVRTRVSPKVAELAFGRDADKAVEDES